jgi:plasmid stabilization system protein ParE
MEPCVVRYLRIALDDLMEIQTFSRRFSISYQTAIIDKVKAYCESLAENPYRATEYEYDVRYRKAIIDD